MRLALSRALEHFKNGGVTWLDKGRRRGVAAIDKAITVAEAAAASGNSGGAGDNAGGNVGGANVDADPGEVTDDLARKLVRRQNILASP